MNGPRSQPYFFSFDTTSVPNKILCHFVTVDTLEVDAGPAFNETGFTLFPADYETDKRLRHLVSAACSYYDSPALKLRKAVEKFLTKWNNLKDHPKDVDAMRRALEEWDGRQG